MTTLSRPPSKSRSASRSREERCVERRLRWSRVGGRAGHHAAEGAGRRRRCGDHGGGLPRRGHQRRQRRRLRHDRRQRDAAADDLPVPASSARCQRCLKGRPAECKVAMCRELPLVDGVRCKGRRGRASLHSGWMLKLLHMLKMPYGRHCSRCCCPTKPDCHTYMVKDHPQSSSCKHLCVFVRFHTPKLSTARERLPI